MSDELLPATPPASPRVVRFFCHGTPAPGGSKTVFFIWDKTGRLVTKMSETGKQMPIYRVVDDAGKGNKLWREAVAAQAKSFMCGAKPNAGPIIAELTHFLKRPGCHYRTGKFAHLLRDDAPRHHTTRPDALKLARATEDALTGIVWLDDGQNIKLITGKKWCDGTEKPGCMIQITFL